MSRPRNGNVTRQKRQKIGAHNAMKGSKLFGPCSVFGGPHDFGMKYTEGVSLYEHHEADLRPDLFTARGLDPLQGVSKRLRNRESLYFAYRFPLSEDRRELLNRDSRKLLQGTVWRLMNPKVPADPGVVAWLVDWGPAEETGRVFDLSDLAANLLGVSTGDSIEGWQV